jgi:predicted transcriptional regulator
MQTMQMENFIDCYKSKENTEKLKKISEKSEWIGEIINEAIENFDDEFERFISLAQSRRVLREQVWKLCKKQQTWG